jgi:mono/diheme cytochrome c family protein
VSGRTKLILAALAAAAMTGCTLAGDVTPPPGSASGPPAAPVGAATEQPVATPPAQAPNPAQVEALFGERCAPCHGDSGQGDGAQGADLPVAPAKLADPSLARPASPADWYNVVTNGRMARYMPPFSSLTDGQRWDLVAYALDLSVAPASLQQGADLYQANCSECHAPDGSGSDNGPSLAALDFYSSRARLDLYSSIRDGSGGGMPGFGPQLSESELWATAAYVQQLAFNSSAVASDTTTDTPDETATAATISGLVSDGASGAAVQDSQLVTLHGFDGQDEVVTQETTVDSRGRFSFEGIELVAGRLYLASTEFQGVRYTSDVAHASDPGEPLDLSITVFESTSDPATVRAPRLHLLIDQMPDGGLRVVELWVLANSGDKTVIADGGTGGVRIALPPQATNLQFEDSLLAQQYQPTDSGFSLINPLRPGGDSAQVVFSFDLQEAKSSEITQAITVPVDAVTVLVVEGGPTVSGDGVTDQGVREAAGEQLHQYDIGPMAAGRTLDLTLTGPPFWAKLIPGSVGGGWIVGAVGLILAVGAIVWWYRPWIAAGDEASVQTDEQVDEPAMDRRQSLLRAMAELDDAYERGEVDESAYHHRRQELKAELMVWMRRADD